MSYFSVDECPKQEPQKVKHNFNIFLNLKSGSDATFSLTVYSSYSQQLYKHLLLMTLKSKYAFLLALGT